ncbi:MAG: transposase [Nitrosomonas sp.]|nr:transposase [Nitrosomonas sp.]
MKKQRFTESQIMQILKQVEGGIAVADLCREYGIDLSGNFLPPRTRACGLS